MGRPKEPMGVSKKHLYKQKRENRRHEAEARALLLGGTYNHHTKCITVTSKGNEKRPWAEEYTYYDAGGNQISAREYSERREHARKLNPEAFRMPSKSFWSNELKNAAMKGNVFSRQQADDAADALRYSIDDEILAELKNGRPEVCDPGSNDVDRPRGARIRIRGPHRPDGHSRSPLDRRL